MINDNPYAAPADDSNRVYDSIVFGGEVWHSGKVLVMDRHARLPARCIKCNIGSGVTMISRKLYYYPPWIALFILCNLIVLIIVALVARKQATVELGMCDACYYRRRRAIAIAWSLVLAGITIALGGPIVFRDPLQPGGPGGIVPLAIVLGIVLILAGIVVGIVRGQMVVVRRIDDRQVRLTGVCRDYVAELPTGP